MLAMKHGQQEVTVLQTFPVLLVQLIYVTSQGSQLAVKALELVLESFAQPTYILLLWAAPVHYWPILLRSLLFSVWPFLPLL